MELQGENIYFSSCNSFSVLGIFILILSLTAILLNSIPLYSFLSWNWKESKSEEHQGFMKTMKVFITTVVCIDFCTMMLAVPSYLLLEFINYGCLDSWITDSNIFHNVCGSWSTLYFGLKLSSLFLVAFASYTTFLHSSKFDDFNSCQHFSCSTEEIHGEENNKKEKNIIITKNGGDSKQHIRMLFFILIVLFLLSFFIGAQPLLNIGPIENVINNTNNGNNGYICNLKSFAKPKSEKQYAFTFSLIMASGGCLLLLLFILVKRDKDTKSSETLSELKKLTSFQACVYMVTWLPLLVSLFIFIFKSRYLCIPAPTVTSQKLRNKFHVHRCREF